MTSVNATSHDAGTEPPRRLIVALWVACGLVALFILLACVLTDAKLLRLLDNLHWTLAYAAASTLAWIGVRRARPDIQGPRRWFAWALTAYTAGQCVWDIQVALGFNSVLLVPSDVLFILLGPLCSVGFIVAVRERSSREQLRAALLDSAGLTVAVLALVLVLLLPRQGQYAAFLVGLLVAYPVVLALAVSLCLITTLRLQTRPRLWNVLFLLALAGQAWIWIEWNQRYLDGRQVDGGLFNATFSILGLLQGFGALYWDTEGVASRRWNRFCDSTLRLLPLFIVVVSGIAVVLTHALPEVSPLARWTTVGAASFVVTLAVMRQNVLLNERERMLDLERTLRMSEEAFRAVVDQAVDGIFVGSATGIILDVNQRAAAMLGTSREELVGLPLLAVVPPEEAGRTTEDLQRIGAGEVITVERVALCKDGSQLQVEVRAKLLSDGRLLAIWRDVTESRKLEEQLQQRQKMEAVGTLAAGIAHDFNNLLMTVRGYADTASGKLPPRHEACESIDGIRRASARAGQLVRQILTFSRPAPRAMAKLRLQDVVGEAVSLLRATLPAGVGIFMDFEPDVPPVMADGSQIHQVVVNLCTNAWHAMEGEPGRIDVSLSCVDSASGPLPDLAPGRYLCLWVRDNGRGMDGETRRRMFEPFFTTKRAQGGTGLGLAVVHGIVRSHAGAIAVQSSPGLGTAVSIYLPVAARPSLATSGEAHAEAAHAMIVDGPVPGAHRVLFVDDEEALVSLAVTELQRRGYGVQGCATASDALAAFGEVGRSFDLVVSDQNMPTMSGLALLREIKGLQPATKCLLISGVVDSPVMESAASIGVDRVLEKPLTFDELGEVIETLLAS